MDEDAIQIFTDIARLGSLAKAAQANFMTQPGVSVCLKKLESQVGGRLFIRTKSGSQLSPLGQQFLPMAKQILGLCDQAKKLTQAHSPHSPQGVVKVAAIYSLGLFQLNQLSSELIKQYPHITLKIQYHTNSDCFHLLKNGEVDIALVVNQKMNSSFQSYFCGQEPLVIIENGFHSKKRQGKTSLKNLNYQNFIAFNEALPTGKLISNLLAENHIKVSSGFIFDNVVLIKRAVEANLGWSIVPLSTVQEETLSQKIAVKKIVEKDFYRKSILVTKKNKALSEATKLLVRFIQKNLF